MLSALQESAWGACVETYGHPPEYLAVAPARVELLGNHTDYNGGLVLAAAIDRFTVVAGRTVDGNEGRVRSLSFEEDERFDLAALNAGISSSWGRYVRGVVWALHEAYGALPRGFDVAITGNVPLGAGLSSSASLQAALGLFLRESGVLGQAAPAALEDGARLALAKALQRGENEFVGVQSGLLDQFSVLFGRAGHALRLDCRSLEYERLPLGDPAPAIVVCDTKTSRRLADGMYNQRRGECERIVRAFQARRGATAVSSLRDIALAELSLAWDDLDPVGRRRARHVLSENERIRRGAGLLRAGELAAFGLLMSESHASSRDDFENSSPALDALIEVAETAPGFLGGKLSGAGWAGCTVNLVVSGQAQPFAEVVREGYALRTGTTPEVHICHAADGGVGFAV
jgi:galactokinase